MTALRFSAISQATYQVPVSRSAHQKQLIVYELEPQDISILDNILLKRNAAQNIPLNQGLIRYFSHSIILRKTLHEAKKLLLLENKQDYQPAKVYLAVVDKQPCGLAIGNTPKRTVQGKITYSNRALPNETELDDLVTWSLPGQVNVKGVGQILLAHIFDFFQTLPADNLYIRSEEPKHTQAMDFYKKMGCEVVGPPTPSESDDSPREVTRIGEKPYTGLIIPMMISKSNAQQQANAIFNKFKQVKTQPESLIPSQTIDFSEQKVSESRKQKFQRSLRRLLRPFLDLLYS